MPVSPDRQRRRAGQKKEHIMKKTISSKDFLATAAVVQQAITAANSNIETALKNKTASGEDLAAAKNCLNAAYLELQILVDNICDDEED